LLPSFGITCFVDGDVSLLSLCHFQISLRRHYLNSLQSTRFVVNIRQPLNAYLTRYYSQDYPIWDSWHAMTSAACCGPLVAACPLWRHRSAAAAAVCPVSRLRCVWRCWETSGSI